MNISTLTVQHTHCMRPCGLLLYIITSVRSTYSAIQIQYIYIYVCTEYCTCQNMICIYIYRIYLDNIPLSPAFEKSIISLIFIWDKIRNRLSCKGWEGKGKTFWCHLGKKKEKKKARESRFS